MGKGVQGGVLAQGVNPLVQDPSGFGGRVSLQHSAAPIGNVDEQQLSSHNISQEVADQIPDTASQDVLTEVAGQARDVNELHQTLDDNFETDFAGQAQYECGLHQALDDSHGAVKEGSSNLNRDQKMLRSAELSLWKPKKTKRSVLIQFHLRRSTDNCQGNQLTLCRGNTLIDHGRGNQLPSTAETVTKSCRHG
ncbi:hypothetical protein V6N13_013237 [Hibiscus sabdariffa]